MDNNYANKLMFDSFLSNAEILKKSLDFYSSMESFPQFLAKEISSRYPKLKTGPNSAAIPPFKFDDTKIVCVVTIELKDKKEFVYQLRLWEINSQENGIEKVKDFLGDIMYKYRLIETDDIEISRTFSFPTDLKELHDCLTDIVSKLQ
jgi:hypothetical protein